MARKHILRWISFVLLTTGISVAARSDTAQPHGVSCLSVDTFPDPPCVSTSDKIAIRTERGVGEDADYEHARRLIINLKGPNDNGDLDKVLVTTQERLANSGRSTLTRSGNAPVVRPAEEPAANLKQRDAIVVVDATSNIPELKVDVSAGAKAQSAGNVVVVADRLQKLEIQADGYNGLAGESVKIALAKKAIEGDGAVPAGIAGDYLERRVADPALALPFDSQDLNNYPASGLVCRADETAVGAAGSYAYDTASDPGSVPSGINVTAFRREETKRALCQRNPEFTITQDCQAEKEYAFQAVCRVKPEGRSVRFHRRDPVTWNRRLCSTSIDTQVRRKIVRTAYVEIIVPGIKAYTGQLTREIQFDETYNIYKNLPAGTWQDIKDDGDAETVSGLFWRNPFWKQAPAILPAATIEVRGPRGSSPALTVNNGFNDPSHYPTDDSEASGSQNRGSKLTYVPRHAPTSGGAAQSEDLFGFFSQNNTRNVYTNEAGTTKYGQQITGCMDIINVNDNERYSSVRQNTQLRNIPTEKYQFYIEYYKALDASILGFSQEDLRGATIRVKNCFAYEVVDGVVPGNVARGDWVLSSNNAEIIPNQPSPNAQPVCPIGFPNLVSNETLVQYERDDSCYVDDPRRPPTWLKKQKADELIRDDLLEQADVDIDQDGTMEESELDNAIGQHAFDVLELSGNSWNVATGTDGPVIPSEKRFLEFSYPSSVTASEIASMTTSQLQNFCVDLPSSGSFFPINSISLGRLSRSVIVPKFNISTGGDIATPTAQSKRICPNGLRLDSYLANVMRPTCPAQSSSKLIASKFSSQHGDGKWETWAQKPVADALPPTNYSFRSEFIDTRYEEGDVPGQIKTAWTSEIHPAVSIPVSGMLVDGVNVTPFTGSEFPPTYRPEFSETVGGIAQRKYPSWLRESYVKNRNGAFISPETFVPFDGNTQFDRANNWCNAPGFQRVGSSIVRGLGAKGILRDAPKRMFSFDLQDVGGSGTTKPYVGIEIGGTTSASGFYGMPTIYSGVIGQQSASSINNSLQKSAFLASLYPYLGARFAETCEAGELYNAFGGFCHDPGTPHESKRRGVERILRDGKTRERWSLRWDLSTLADPTDRVDMPFTLDMQGHPRPTGQIDLVSRLQTSLLQLGAFRPLVKMADDLFIQRGILMNRPESLSRMVLGPGFAASRDSDSADVCQQQFRMIAVPVPPASVSVGGILTSVTLDRDNYLPPGSVFVAVDTRCDAGVFTALGTIRRLDASGGLEPTGALTVNQFTFEVDPTDSSVVATFRDGAPNPLFRMRRIKEAVVAGVSATTGEEDLEIVEISPPKLRDRSVEWSQVSRSKGGKGWQSKIKTNPTAPTQDQNTQPRTCSSDNLRGGPWGNRQDNNLPITNGHETADCSLITTDCALNAEELSLFAIPAPNSKAITVTRPAATQFTPWSHEIATSAAKNPNFVSTRDFGAWTQIEPGRDGSSVPACDVFNGAAGEPDQTLVRSSFEAIDPSLVQIDTSLLKIRKPNDLAQDFLVLPLDESVRKSESCVRWDSVTGTSCEVFHSTVGGPEVQALIFGGQWQHVFVETKERVAQTCREFESVVGGGAGPTCKAGNDAGGRPFREPKGAPRVAFCSPNSCEFQSNVQSFQVEASTPVSGDGGEDGTNSGGATVFCRDCRNIQFFATPGVGGRGSSPVSSDRSKTLTCVSWNSNPLAPIFSVRNLWSQPFIGGAAGQNGRSGDIGGELKIYSDLTSEAVFMLQNPAFWVGPMGE